MLNISPHSVSDKVDRKEAPALAGVESKRSGRALLKMLTLFGLLILIMMFVPWTQNIRGKGLVTTLRPDQRPQTVHSIIPGRIEKWFVNEGDFVAKGDTILYISEIKDEYMDPALVGRTEQQLKSKELAVGSYMQKVQSFGCTDRCLGANRKAEARTGKEHVDPIRTEGRSDSIDLVAAQINADIAEEQFKRIEQLFDQGLKSKTDKENRELKMQKALANEISAENKLLTSRNEVINAMVELNSIRAQYQDDVAKAESEKYTAMSDMYDTEVQVTKLQNQFMSYSVRTGYYYITAPQDGYVTKAIKSGIGETIKEGAEIISIMPSSYDLAVSMYVRPIDLPLVKKGNHVRIQFDGWPAIVFSGWPNTSYGTYGGTVFAIDNFASENGMYRILVSPGCGRVSMAGCTAGRCWGEQHAPAQ